MTTIKSVQEYLEIIKTIKIKNNLFFRGHADKSYVLKPGIYREINGKGNKTLIDYEDQIYREVISKSPHEFLGKTTLDSLALMQHYESPTRILDLTENALVALFFAVNKNDDRDGEVIIFDIPDEFVCHYNSDKVTALSNISKCGKDFKYSENFIPILTQKINEVQAKMTGTPSFNYTVFTYIYSFFNHHFEDVKKLYKNDEFELKNYDMNLNRYKKKYEVKYGKLNKIDFIKFKIEFNNVLLKILHLAIDENIKDCNQSFFGKLLHNIREDKSYFDGIIDPRHISKVFAVRPKLDNPRITRQQGAFLIFGVKASNNIAVDGIKPMADLNIKWVVKGLKKPRMVIDKLFKKSIKEELEQLGINQSILFPEVDKVADFVRNKYQDKL